jgi:hypothetical protein
MRTETQRLTGMLSAPSLLTLAVLAGCGGSSESADPADNFIGRWELLPNTTTTAFTLTCNAMPQPYIQWVELVFEHGSVTDLIDTSGLLDREFGCSPILPYNIAGDRASIVNPDPYLGGAPFCEALAFDAMGAAVALLEFVPGADWAFELQPKVADKPQEGILKGSATVTPFVPNDAGMLVADPACTYSSGASGDRFFRLTTQP